MADGMHTSFIPYSIYEKVERKGAADAKPDKIVRLAPDRWQSLVDYIRVNYGDQRPGEEITVYEATDVNGILYLPALYHAA